MIEMLKKVRELRDSWCELGREQGQESETRHGRTRLQECTRGGAERGKERLTGTNMGVICDHVG